MRTWAVICQARSSPSVSTLANGLTVVTEDASSSTTVSITYPKAGSASELPSEEGAALVNKCLAFNSGSGLSTMMIMRNIEDDGGVPFIEAGRFGLTHAYLTRIPASVLDRRWDWVTTLDLSYNQIE